MSETEFNSGWAFVEGHCGALGQTFVDGVAVDLPHSAVELPYDYFDEACYQKPFAYQKRVDWSTAFEGKSVRLRFDGAMANAKVFANGVEIGAHPDGYTPFEVSLDDHLAKDGVLVTVALDGAENPDIPPFGGRIDYLTYAGIYRDVWLKVVDPVSISNLRIVPENALSDNRRLIVDCHVTAPSGTPVNGIWNAQILDGTGEVIGEAETNVTGPVSTLVFDDLSKVVLWSPSNPTLYTLRLTLEANGFKDVVERPFGFREAEFRPDGFYLNGERIKLIGLNRHQSFPYTGYAQGRASQERDAEILKHELGCNIVRTSHYPQSPWFLDHCDRIGLLVLEEIPGWQHTGGQAWKDESVRNVRRMIERDWNHPSIILWGVRINESDDDSAFYARTNALARELDPTRQTGGIRKHVESEFLEDVYTFNDFILGDFELPFSNRPRTSLRSQRESTGLDRDVPYIVTEFNGHMYPTKVFDQEQRQVEHVTRHLDVLEATFADDAIAGCIGWCMFDYNTHKDFGSGDRICHHGVMTMFREPKHAAYAYASQADPSSRVVLHPVTFWARGERNIGGVLPLMILTNCDTVDLIFPGGTKISAVPDRERYPSLPHAPMLIQQDGTDEAEMGRWGMEWQDADLVGYIAGKEVARRKLKAGPVAHRLDVAPDATVIHPDHGEVRVAVRALDQGGNLLPFLQSPISVSIDGPARLVGPEVLTLRGGSTAFWIRPIGDEGELTVQLSCPRFGQQEIILTVVRA